MKCWKHFFVLVGHVEGWIEDNDFELHPATLLSEASPLPLKQTVILASPRVPWIGARNKRLVDSSSLGSPPYS